MRLTVRGKLILTIGIPLIITYVAMLSWDYVYQRQRVSEFMQQVVLGRAGLTVGILDAPWPRWNNSPTPSPKCWHNIPTGRNWNDGRDSWGCCGRPIGWPGRWWRWNPGPRWTPRPSLRPGGHPL